jgi:hypothetical protein
MIAGAAIAIAVCSIAVSTYTILTTRKIARLRKRLPPNDGSEA